jgi:tetratricopeptide (TPR) repeat protein
MQGKLDEANTLYLRALEGRQREGSLGRSHLDTLRTVEGLGRIAEDQQRYSEAEKRYRRVLTGFQKQMPEGCPDVVRAVENMARILEKLRRHEDAIPYYRRPSTTSKSESNDDEAEMERRSSDFSVPSVPSGSGSSKGTTLERWQSSSSRRLSTLTKSESIREEPDIERWSEDLRNLSMCSSSENPELPASLSSTQGQ